MVGPNEVWKSWSAVQTNQNLHGRVISERWSCAETLKWTSFRYETFQDHVSVPENGCDPMVLIAHRKLREDIPLTFMTHLFTYYSERWKPGNCKSVNARVRIEPSSEIPRIFRQDNAKPSMLKGIQIIIEVNED